MFFKEIIARIKGVPLLLSSLLIAMCLLALVALPFSFHKKHKIPNSSKLQAIDEDFTPDNDLILPRYFNDDEYQFSRSNTEGWSKEDIQKYFHEIDETDLQKLRESNQKITDNIIGVAP